MNTIPEPSYQKFAKDVLVIGAANVLVALSGILLLPLFTKIPGAHDYGIWTSWVNCLSHNVFSYLGDCSCGNFSSNSYRCSWRNYLRGVILLLLKGFKEEEIKFFKGLFQRGS